GQTQTLSACERSGSAWAHSRTFRAAPQPLVAVVSFTILVNCAAGVLRRMNSAHTINQKTLFCQRSVLSTEFSTIVNRRTPTENHSPAPLTVPSWRSEETRLPT